MTNPNLTENEFTADLGLDLIENLLLYSKIKSSDLIAYNIIVVGIAFLSVLVPVAEVKLR